MKLIILCGSLEPGKDGVGDYSRQLAEVCRSSGHHVFLCSLNDSWIDANLEKTGEMRLARSLPWPERMAALRRVLTSFQPDVVSLQFVPYAYQVRGFCDELVRELGSITGEFRWHLMFHELWLGLDAADSWKFKIVGWLQRRSVLRLVRVLAPAATHTQTAVYARCLERESIPAVRLPIFSNITMVPQPDFGRFYELLASRGVELKPEDRARTFVIVFFGSLHPEWNPAMLLQKISGNQLLFLSLGRLGPAGAETWQRFARACSSEAQFSVLGELNPEMISTALQFADSGVAASPWNLIEKSGSVAAMIEHGLPVIVTRNDFLTEQTFALNPAWSPQLYPVWEPDFRLSVLRKRAPHSQLPEIAAQFVSDLEKSLAGSGQPRCS